MFRWRGFRKVRNMSLNHTEETLFEYLRSHAEERHYWEAKVQAAMGKSSDSHAVSTSLALELWQYLEERSRSVPVLCEAGPREPGARISLRNLAEYMMRIWGPIRVANRSRSKSTHECP